LPPGGASFAYITYKVIIRILLSGRRLRYMVTTWAAISPPPLVKERNMSWTAPVIVEVCIGMEITSYVSAEI